MYGLQLSLIQTVLSFPENKGVRITEGLLLLHGKVEWQRSNEHYFVQALIFLDSGF